MGRTRDTLLAACGAFLAVWGIGLACLAPGFPHGDSGETVAVALRLGIAHPPGYPLPTLLGRMMVWAIPAGSPAWRVSLLSLAAAALAASLAACFLRHRRPEIPATLAILLALPAGLALEMWNQMTLPKGCVYTVSVALLGALALTGLMKRERKMMALIGLVFGLACGCHFMIVLPCLALASLVLLARLLGTRNRARTLIMACLMAVLGVSLYIYLPLRSAGAHAALRWAEPNKLERFNWLVLRRQYFSIESQERGEGGQLLLGRFASRFGAGFGFGGLVLVALGAGLAAGRRDWWLLALAGGGAIEIGAAAIYPKLEADALWVADPFFSSGWYLAGLLIGTGLADLSGWGGRRARLVAMAAGVFIVAHAVAGGWRLADKGRNYFASDQQANLVSTVPERALLFCEGDAYIAPLLHGLWVDGKRTDIRMIIPIFLNFDWGLRQLKELYPDLVFKRMKPWSSVWGMAKDIMEAHGGQAWLYTLTTSKGWPFRKYASPRGLTYEIKPGKKGPPDPGLDRAMFRYRLRDTMNPARIRCDPFKDVLLENYVKAHFYRGIQHNELGNGRMALKHFERGRRLGSPECALNAGLIHYRNRDPDAAGKCWRQAANLAPDRPQPHANLGLLALEERRPDESIAHCERAIRISPEFAKSYEVLANAWFMKGDAGQAIRVIERGLAASPGDERLKKLMRMIMKRLKKSRAR